MKLCYTICVIDTHNIIIHNLRRSFFFPRFTAGQTHEAGKSGHPGDDGAAPAVAAPERSTHCNVVGARGGRCASRSNNGRRFVAVVRRPDRGGRPKVPDGLPGVRGRGEPVRRPVGRCGRRHQEAFDVASGLVRGQNEVRRGGDRGPAAAAAARTQLPVAAPAAHGPVGGGPAQAECRGSPALVAAVRPRARPVVRAGAAAAAAAAPAARRTSPDERVHRGTRCVVVGHVRFVVVFVVLAAGHRSPDAVRRVLRRARGVVHQFVGRRRGRGRCSSSHRNRRQEPAAGLFDEKAGGVQKTFGRHIGKRSYGHRRRRLDVAQDRLGHRRWPTRDRRRADRCSTRGQTLRPSCRRGPEHVETLVTTPHSGPSLVRLWFVPQCARCITVSEGGGIM